MRRKLALFLFTLLLLSPVTARAAAVESGSVYCFAAGDFTGNMEGAALLETPDTGVLRLDRRVIREGDVLTMAQLENLTFTPYQTEVDNQATVIYLPVSEAGIGQETAFTLGIRGKENKPPVAEDSTLETYKNLPNTGSLRASDPEGEPLSFSVTRQPRRGEVVISQDGSFTYTPKNNKVGVDSFAYTASDPGGKVSREATVTITILRPTEPTAYTDTLGTDCCFEAEWMRSSGIFSGESLAQKPVFQPGKEVTKGEFLAMAVKTLSIPVEDTASDQYGGNLPQWLRPYATAALRAGLTDRQPWQEWQADETAKGEDAAALLCSALDLDADEKTQFDELREREIVLSEGEALTRQTAAIALYRLSELKKVE